MKKTRNALIISVFSLLLCISTLLSTTFAWLTDLETSSGNVVQSGNLTYLAAEAKSMLAELAFPEPESVQTDLQEDITR